MKRKRENEAQGEYIPGSGASVEVTPGARLFNGEWFDVSGSGIGDEGMIAALQVLLAAKRANNPQAERRAIEALTARKCDGIALKIDRSGATPRLVCAVLMPREEIERLEAEARRNG